MRVVVLPGVFRPRSDRRLLARHAVASVCSGDRVLELCAGSGIVSVACALRGARVTAVDVSRRAVANTGLNARLNGVSVRSLRGDLEQPVESERFDLIVSNPPYVPAATDRLPGRGRKRAWAAGHDGRAFLDRICRSAPARLPPGGQMLLVHSDFCGTERTLAQLRETGLTAEVIGGQRGPLGPLMRAQADRLERRGLLTGDEETVVVIHAHRPTSGT